MAALELRIDSIPVPLDEVENVAPKILRGEAQPLPDLLPPQTPARPLRRPVALAPPELPRRNRRPMTCGLPIESHWTPQT